MKDTIEKMRALLNMKTVLIDVFRADNKALTAKCEELQSALDVACKEIVILRREADPWWKYMDEEVARLEAEEQGTSLFIPFSDDELNNQKRQKAHFESVGDKT